MWILNQLFHIKTFSKFKEVKQDKVLDNLLG